LKKNILLGGSVLWEAWGYGPFALTLNPALSGQGHKTCNMS